MNKDSKSGWNLDEPIILNTTVSEMLTHGENEALKIMGGEYWPVEDPLQTWLTSCPQLAQQTLDEAIEAGPTVYDRSQYMVGVSISSAPVGFYGMGMNAASHLDLTTENFHRIASKHGVGIMATDPRTRDMWKIFGDITCKELEKPNRFVRATIINPSYYAYETTAFAYTSIPVIWWVNELLKVLATVYGITTNALISIAIYHSLITLKHDCISPHDKMEIDKELKFFWKWAAVRKDTLIRIGKELN